MKRKDVPISYFMICCVIKTSYQKREFNEEAENAFRYDPSVKFMVVVAMSGIGWNFDKLDCVLDLTFTRNINLLIQRISRLCRIRRGKKPKFIMCADNSREPYDAHMVIGEALALMREDGIRNYKELLIYYDEDLVHKSIGSSKRDEVIELGPCSKYFREYDFRIIYTFFVTNKSKSIMGMVINT